ILTDIQDCGYIGEETNKLVSYIAMTSRKMDDPLSVLVISGSGAGKSSLQDTILSLCPEEDLIKLTSITGKALFYKKEKSLANKVLAIEEEKGAEDAGYAIRNLISAKELTIEATIKDNYTGKMTTMENKVTGPTAVFKTTTNPETDPETKNRFIVLSIDESKRQTQKILDYQRKMQTIQGLLTKESKGRIIKREKNFQRILCGLKIINPYAEKLTYIDDRIQVRREHPKYLNLINGIAFLRQYQKEIKTLTKNGEKLEYIEVDPADIEIANKLAEKVLGASLQEVSQASRDLYKLTKQMTVQMSAMQSRLYHQIEFTRRDIRTFTDWTDYQIKTHLRQLVELEYIIPQRGRKGQQYKYKLLPEDEIESKENFKRGLINVERLTCDSREGGNLTQNPLIARKENKGILAKLGDLAKLGEAKIAKFYHHETIENTGLEANQT
ncbi:MAG: DNA primase, partial [Promethearchaeota archaeon]